MIFQFREGFRLGNIFPQKAVISLFPDILQQCLEGRSNIANESKIERGSAAYVFRILVDLYFLYIRTWKEFRKWEIGPEHQKEIGMVDRSISAAVSQQTRQSDSVGIVVLQPLLTSQRVADWRLQSCGQLDYFFACVSAPIAAKNCDSASLVYHVREAAQVRIRRTKHRRRRDVDLNWSANRLRR